MTNLIPKIYEESFSQFDKPVGGNGVVATEWLRALRRTAFSRFSELGFPTTRDEDWRFTNLAPIAQTSFKLAQEERVDVSPRDLEPYRFAGPACNLLVFVNGKHAPKLSTSRSLAKGLKVSSLTEAMKSDKSFVEQHLAKYVDYHRDAFSALNTAFMTDGAFVSIPKGTILDEPIYLLYVSTASSAPTISHPRNLIIVGEDCQAAIVEDYVSLSDDAQFSNVVTELIVGDNSVVSHHLIERENDHSFNVSTLRIQQGRSSNVSSHSLLVGGAIVRNNIHPVLAGEGGDCLINGLFMANGRQHMDNYMKVEHASPHCGSRQFYNGILDGKSHGVFHGRIIVHKNAQKTDAKQTNRNLLLSDSAQIDTKPQLEIYADDVKCTHGATIGQIDDEAIFYLRSRGITVDSARALLLSAFAGESLQRIKVDSIRQHAEALVAQWLPQINILEKLT